VGEEKYGFVKKRYIHLPLTEYFFDQYSQNGEDGILNEIFNRLGCFSDGIDNWCVEFGAWDGKHLSNTFALVEGRNWNAVYIEANKERFGELLATAKNFSRILPISSLVEPYGTNSLDKLLKSTPVPESFSLLSIDIDSYDLDVWESLSLYTPKVVVIEINSSIPPGIFWRHSKNTPGNTFSATTKVATQKGYTLVCHTGNLIFVRNSELQAMNFPKRFIDNPELLFLYESEWTEGNPFMSKPMLKEISKEIRHKMTKQLTNLLNLKKSVRNIFKSHPA